jgi:hypothetical protein
MRTKIEIRRDGSGTISLEYRFSRVLEGLGGLDGNERWLPLPAGKADFERSLQRVPGLVLRSFASREDERDRINTVTLEFANPEALLRFLDAGGGRASLIREGGDNRLSLQLRNLRPADGDLTDLLRAAGEDYSLELRLILPSAASLAFTGGRGEKLAAPPAGKGEASGREVSYVASMAELLSSPDPVFMEIRWRD